MRGGKKGPEVWCAQRTKKEDSLAVAEKARKKTVWNVVTDYLGTMAWKKLQALA